MKAARFHQFGGTEVLRYEEAPDPVPQPGEVVIRVRACGLNHVDLDLRDGTSRIPLVFPFIPGVEIAGEVVALGPGVTDVRTGDRVTPTFYYPCRECGQCRSKRENKCENGQMFGVTRPGGYAELVAAPAKHLMKIPANVSFDQAAATQVAFGTAFHMLHRRAAMKRGETVLVQAAGSGVGSAAIQITREAGLTIIATAGSERKLALARELGAAKTINYRQRDFVEEVMDFTAGRGVDIVFEHVGGEVFTDSVRCLAVGGRIVTCGAHAGETPKIDLIELFRREASVIGSYTATIFELKQVMLLVETGKVTPVIHDAFPLAEAAHAQRVLAGREAFGKVLLKP